MNTLQFIPIQDIPLIKPGDDLGWLIYQTMAKQGLTLYANDIVIVAQKIVSKAEDCFVRMADVTPSPQAMALSETTGKPPALVEVILWDTAEIIRMQKDVLIVEHKLGFISANAGVDHSNVSPEEGVLLRLPPDPGHSARQLRRRLGELMEKNRPSPKGAKTSPLAGGTTFPKEREGGRASHQLDNTNLNENSTIEIPPSGGLGGPPVLIIDSHGRPWRFGTVGVTIGLSGIAPLQDLRQAPDLFDTPLEITIVGFTDQLAAAASLAMGQAAEGCPVVIARGVKFTPDDTATAADVLRPKNMDLFR